MGLEALFDESIFKKKVEKTDYEKGKDYCCNSICKNISEGIEYHTEQIDDILIEYSLIGKTYSNSLVVQSKVNDDRIAIKTLQNLRSEIMKNEPYCKC